MLTESVDQWTRETCGESDELIGEDQRGDTGVESSEPGASVRSESISEDLHRHPCGLAGDQNGEGLLSDFHLIVRAVRLLLHQRHVQWHFVASVDRVIDLDPHSVFSLLNDIHRQFGDIERHEGRPRFIQKEALTEVGVLFRLHFVGREILRVVTVGHIDVAEGIGRLQRRSPTAASRRAFRLAGLTVGITIEPGDVGGLLTLLSERERTKREEKEKRDDRRHAI